MEVKPTGPDGDAMAQAAARGAGGPPADGDIRSRMQQLTIRQQLFERYVAKELEVDAAGLATMDRLMSAGPSSPTALARHLGISTAAMTLVLNRLEAAGHIHRDRHPTDRRKVVVTASNRSAEAAHSRVLPLIDGVGELVATMTVQERQTVGSFLDRMIDIYDGAIAGE